MPAPEMPSPEQLQSVIDFINTQTVTVYDAEDICGLCHTTIRRRAKLGDIRFVTIAGVRRLYRVDVEKLERRPGGPKR